MKIGDRIRIFELKNNGNYRCIANCKGLQRPEIGNSGLNDGFPILLVNDLRIDKSKFNLTFFENSECKHVATMVITKLK